MTTSLVWIHLKNVAVPDAKTLASLVFPDYPRDADDVVSRLTSGLCVTGRIRAITIDTGNQFDAVTGTPLSISVDIGIAPIF